MISKFALTQSLVLALVATVATVAISAGTQAQAAVSTKLPQVETLAQITLMPTYLDGLTNDQFPTGSNSFGAGIKKDGSEELTAQLRLNAGVGKEANVLSKAPNKLHLVLSHIAGNKTTEKTRLAFKGFKTSAVGTRVLTFESRGENGAKGRLVAKVQQGRLSHDLWKTTAAAVQFIPDSSRF